jgi:hypothetical protein
VNGNPYDELFCFLSANEKNAIYTESAEEELLEGLRRFRDAGDDTAKVKTLIQEFSTSKSEVRYVLTNDNARPTLLQAVNISRGFRDSVMMSTKFLTPARKADQPKVSGRLPATDVSTHQSD